MDAMFAVPHGEELAVFEDYPSAQELVDTLVNGGVEASAVSIVGRDVTLVERVTAKVGNGRVALQSAVNGSWLGVLVGLVVVLVNPVDVVTPLLVGVYLYTRKVLEDFVNAPVAKGARAWRFPTLWQTAGRIRASRLIQHGAQNTENPHLVLGAVERPPFQLLLVGSTYR